MQPAVRERGLSGPAESDDRKHPRLLGKPRLHDLLALRLATVQAPCRHRHPLVEHPGRGSSRTGLRYYSALALALPVDEPHVGESSKRGSGLANLPHGAGDDDPLRLGPGAGAPRPREPDLVCELPPFPRRDLIVEIEPEQQRRTGPRFMSSASALPSAPRSLPASAIVRPSRLAR